MAEQHIGENIKNRQQQLQPNLSASPRHFILYINMNKWKHCHFGC